MKSKVILNRKSLKSFRSSLMNRSTSAEAALREMLKSRKLEGRKFRRQYSIGVTLLTSVVLQKNL